MKRTRRTTQTVTVVTENPRKSSLVTLDELERVLSPIPDIGSMRVQDALNLRDHLNRIFGYKQ